MTVGRTEPLAYFLTWTCHGTWLHGDPRGSVDRHRNTPGTDVYDPNSAWSEWSRSRVGAEPVNLGPKAREVVQQTIEAHCHYRGWTLITRHVRTNHVHLIVTSDRSPQRTIDELKAWCTRRLREA